jgi:hypothetical protein
VSFANCPLDTDNVVSAELQRPGNILLHFPVPKLDGDLPDFSKYRLRLEAIKALTLNDKVVSSTVVEQSGAYGAIVNMMLGNKV